MKWLLVLILIAVPLTASAAADSWQTCGTTHEGGAVLGADKLFLSPKSQKTLCYDTDGTADSAVLATGGCDHLDALVFNMTDTSVDKAVSILTCGDSACGGSFVVENKTLTGDETADTEAIYGFGADWIKVDWTTNTGNDDMRVLVRCNNY